jgi:alpha-N-arabinofuranosidase
MMEPNRRNRGAALVLLAAALGVPIGPMRTADAQAPATTIRVDPAARRGAISPFVYGSNHRYVNNGIGTWDPKAWRIVPAFDRNHREIGLKAIRYPGGTVGNTFEWKKAIGPVEQRPKIQPFSGGGTPTGLFGAPDVATFGVDEAARWCEASGVEMIYMYGIAFGDPRDAADLVEYLDAPVGKNPNGGTDWARVRAENGHPEPYHVRSFEIANEADGPSQRHWWPFLDTDETRAKKTLPFQRQRDSYAPEYCFGGIARFERQPAGVRDGRGGRDFRDAAARSDGHPGQTKAIRHVPIEPGSDTVFVGDDAWRRVPEIEAVTGRAYQIDPETGVIRFGDGRHGDVPPAGAAITVSYRSRRHGFVDYVAAMKAVDPKICIYAGYESHAIIKTLGAKHPFDGIVVHPYTNQYNVPSAATLEDWHHNLMLSAARPGHEIAAYQEAIDRTVAPGRRGQVHVVCTEFGAVRQELVMPPCARRDPWRFLGIGLYNGVQLLHWMRVGVPHADRHATTVGVFGPAPDFEPSASARVYEVFTHHFGSRLIGVEVENNPGRATKVGYQARASPNGSSRSTRTPPPGGRPR